MVLIKYILENINYITAIYISNFINNFMQSKFIYLIIFLILVLFIASACQYQKPIGKPIESNEEEDIDPISACRRGCDYSYYGCADYCGGNEICRNQCFNVWSNCWDRCVTVEDIDNLKP